MAKFTVRGGKQLEGIYPVSGAKNSAPKLLIASLLSDKLCTFHNISRISDTFRSIDAISALGASVRFIGKNSVEITADKIFSSEIPLEAMSARQSVLFIGATLARAGHVKIFPPRGDEIGKRPLNRHLEGIQALGGTIKEKNGYLEIDMPQQPASVVYTFEKNTHCGTENMILASVFNQGKVILKNAAEEPEVDNLIECLNAMGAHINRIQKRAIEIVGVKPLLNGVETTSIYDRLEAATALILSIMNGGKITVKNAPRILLEPLTGILENIGVEFNWDGNNASIANIKKPLKPANITTDWHPGFMTDWQPLMTLVLACMSDGKSIIHERIFETRWRYLKEIAKMGIQYELFQPNGFGPKDYNFNDAEYSEKEAHAAYVCGPSKLNAAEVNSHDVRAGIDLLLAALIAPGKSVINDPQNHIDRGYENIVEKLINLGADIKRI